MEEIINKFTKLFHEVGDLISYVTDLNMILDHDELEVLHDWFDNYNGHIKIDVKNVFYPNMQNGKYAEVKWDANSDDCPQEYIPIVTSVLKNIVNKIEYHIDDYINNEETMKQIRIDENVLNEEDEDAKPNYAKRKMNYKKVDKLDTYQFNKCLSKIESETRSSIKKFVDKQKEITMSKAIKRLIMNRIEDIFTIYGITVDDDDYVALADFFEVTLWTQISFKKKEFENYMIDKGKVVK